MFRFVTIKMDKNNMNNKLYAQLAILLYALILPIMAMADDYKSAHNQHLVKAQKLPEIVKEVFALNDTEAGEPAFIVDDFFDPERVKLRIELKVLFSLAVDLNVDMSALSTYGLNRLESGTYTIDYYETPQWGAASDIFYNLSMPNYFDKKTKTALRKNGFSDEDFAVIDEYIRKHNINIEVDTIILDSLPSIKKRVIQTKSTNTKAALTLNYGTELSYKIEHHWFKWSQKLLIKFPRVKQQALINYYVDNIGFSQISATPKSETSEANFVKRLESGIFHQQIDKRIKKITSIIEGVGHK